MRSVVLVLGWVCIGSLLWSNVRCAPGEPAQRCCYDQQYSVIMGDIGAGVDPNTGQTYIDDSFVRLSKDYYYNRYGTNITVRNPDGSKTSQISLRDYDRRLTYIVEDDGTCTYTQMPTHEQMHQSCIPDDAIFQGRSILGYGTNMLQVNTWRYTHNVTEHDIGMFTMTVTSQHCVPVMETLVATINGNPMEQTLFFTKYHPGIVDLAFLVPPNDCTPVAPGSHPTFISHGFFEWL